MIRMILGLFIAAAAVGGVEIGDAGILQNSPWLFAGMFLFLWGSYSLSIRQ
jgi:hypothetical protein